MEGFIVQAFTNIEGFGPHVMNGHYDLEGPEGELIVKEIWRSTVQPGWQITMKMWPANSHPLRREQQQIRPALAETDKLANEHRKPSRGKLNM